MARETIGGPSKVKWKVGRRGIAQFHNPERIESSSPGLPSPRGYPGFMSQKIFPTLKGLYQTAFAVPGFNPFRVDGSSHRRPSVASRRRNAGLYYFNPFRIQNSDGYSAFFPLALSFTSGSSRAFSMFSVEKYLRVASRTFSGVKALVRSGDFRISPKGRSFSR